MSLTDGLPKVKVPVLSNAAQLTFPIFSNAAPDFTMTPYFAACPIAAITDVGVANTSAQGQNTTSTVTARVMSPVNKYVATAITKAEGTSHDAHLSTIRSVGDLFCSASRTISTSFPNDESLPTFKALMSTEPKRLIVPQYTLSPIPLSTGSDSPVITDWSTDVCPDIISPSTGIDSPGKTLNISPAFISSSTTSFSPPSVTILPRAGASDTRFFIPLFARSTVISSRMPPIAIIKATSPAAKTSPI